MLFRYFDIINDILEMNLEERFINTRKNFIDKHDSVDLIIKYISCIFKCYIMY